MKLGILCGIAGGFISFFAFVILQNLSRATDAQGFILIGTVILCVIICFCTGLLIETYYGRNINKKDL
jgi:Na+/melibiose symporter-like transporter